MIQSDDPLKRQKISGILAYRSRKSKKLKRSAMNRYDGQRRYITELHI